MKKKWMGFLVAICACSACHAEKCSCCANALECKCSGATLKCSDRATCESGDWEEEELSAQEPSPSASDIFPDTEPTTP